MRRCEYCGRQFADKVLICPEDALPTVNPHAKPASAAGSSGHQIAFNAQIVSPFSAAGTYRVYARGNDWLFIQTDSRSHSVLNYLAPLLGPVGGLLISVLAWLFSRQQAKDYQQHLETQDPENLLNENPKNFRLSLGEIREAVLEPPPHILLTGTAIGCATLLVRTGEKLKLAFPKREDMDALGQRLAPALRSALRVTVEWSATAEHYQKLPSQKLDRKNELP